jgi:hypothetical protein
MTNGNREFYDNGESEQNALSLQQFLERLSQEFELNYVNSNDFRINLDNIFDQIQASQDRYIEEITIAFSEKDQKVYLITCIEFDGFIVQEIGYNNFPINNNIKKYDIFGDLESNN